MALLSAGRPRVVTMPEETETTTTLALSPTCVVTMTPRTISPPSSPPRLQYSRPSLLRESSCSQTLFADCSDFMAAEPSTPAKEATEAPAPVAAPKKAVRFAEGTKLAPPLPLERALTIENLEENSLFGDLLAPPAKRVRFDSPEPNSGEPSLSRRAFLASFDCDEWTPLDAGDEYGREMPSLSTEYAELLAAL